MDKFKNIAIYNTPFRRKIIEWIFFPLIRHNIRKRTSSCSLEYAGDRQQIERDLSHGAFFMTNHRDIITDSIWLALLLHDRYRINLHPAIGNNLFGRRWIEWLVRSWRAFVVIRDGGIHDQIANAKLLSEYIRLLRSSGESIWMAQRQGRAKDGNDLTEPAVLKMLTIDNKDFLTAIKQLNICPVSINYEFDPCDYLKAEEMQQKRDNPNWKKTKEDDIRSMTTGLKGFKGRTVFRLTPSINHDIDDLLAADPTLPEQPRNTQIRCVCSIIDRHIHSAYELYSRGEAFEQYLNRQFDKCVLPDKDKQFMLAKMHEMYNNPDLNYKKAHA